MYPSHPYVAEQAARDYSRDRIREAETLRTARAVRSHGSEHRPAAARTAGALVLSALLCLAVSGVLVAVTSGDSSASYAGSRRPRPTATATGTPSTATATPTSAPTPTATATPTATVTPTGTTSPTTGSCPDAVPWGGTTYCPAAIGELVRNTRPLGLGVVVQRVTVVGGYGQSVTVMGGTWCPPGMWCGQVLDFMDVSFPAGATVPAYGDVIDLYGRVITGGLSPDGFTVVGHCDPELSC